VTGALPPRRSWGHVVAAVALMILTLAAPAVAATMCHTAGASTERLAALTGRASGKFLQAASHGMLAVKALEDSPTAFPEQRARVTELLDAAIADHREALATGDDLKRVDEFLRAREFARLRLTFGITPGTLNATRWETIARIARDSRTPTADLIGVCVAGAEMLKSTIADLKPDARPSMIRRATYAWFLVLTHGGLVSDALDAAVR